MSKKNSENIKKDNRVFYASLIITLPICLWAIVSNETFTSVVNTAFNFFTVKFSWLYLVSMMLFVIFALWLAFSKYGNLKLGLDDSRPDYKTSSWFAMLFGAGMGIGLVFWGSGRANITFFITERRNRASKYRGCSICYEIFISTLGSSSMGRI